MEYEANCPAHPEAELKTHLARTRDQFFAIDDALRFDYLQCSKCRALVLSPRPKPNEIGQFYAEYYPPRIMNYLRAAANRGRPIGFAGRARARGFLRRFRKLGGSLEKTTQLLDVGCGLGSFPRHVRDMANIQTRGVDFSPECSSFAKDVHKLEVDIGELSAQNYEDGQFDIVTSWHYMEHVYSPRDELQEMARILKPGGWLMAETPTPDFLFSLFRKRWLYLMPPTHLYHYKPTTLQTLMEQSGFEIVKVVRPWFPGELAGSIMLTLGVNGFVPKVFGPNRPLHHRLLTVCFLSQMLFDIPITLTLAMLGRSGLLRVFARKKK